MIPALLCLLTLAASQQEVGVVIDAGHAELVIELLADGHLCDQDVEALRDVGVSPDVINALTSRSLDQRMDWLGREWGRAYIELPLPAPLRDSDLEEVASRLQLSDAQASFLKYTYETSYRTQAVALWENVTTPLWERAGAYVEADRDSAEAAALNAKVFADCRTSLPRLRALDEAFLDVLIPSLTEEQLARLESVKLWRRRSITPADARRFPGGCVDLTAVLLRLEQDHPASAVSDQEAVQSVLSRYESDLTRRHTELIEARCDVAAATGWWFARGGAASPPSNAEVLQEFTRSRKRFCDAALGVHRLNLSVIEELSSLMSSPMCEQLRDSYRRLAFPVIYDVLDDVALEFIDSKQDEADVMPAQLGLLSSIAESHAAKIEAIDRLLQERVVDWKRSIFIDNGFQHDDYRAYRDEMQGLVAQRCQLQVETLSLIGAMVPDWQEELDQLRNTAERQRDQVTLAEGGVSGLGWPGPNDGYLRSKDDRCP